MHAGYLAEEVVPAVPAPVLAEAWRGGSRQASLSRLLRMCDTEPMNEELARNVGVLAGKSGHDDIVDVSVVEGAVRRRRADQRHPRGQTAARHARRTYFGQSRVEGRLICQRRWVIS